MKKAGSVNQGNKTLNNGPDRFTRMPFRVSGLFPTASLYLCLPGSTSHPSEMGPRLDTDRHSGGTDAQGQFCCPRDLHQPETAPSLLSESCLRDALLKFLEKKGMNELLSEGGKEGETLPCCQLHDGGFF